MQIRMLELAFAFKRNREETGIKNYQYIKQLKCLLSDINLNVIAFTINKQPITEKVKLF
jgi:hypothetical protein